MLKTSNLQFEVKLDTGYLEEAVDKLNRAMSENMARQEDEKIMAMSMSDTSSAFWFQESRQIKSWDEYPTIHLSVAGRAYMLGLDDLGFMFGEYDAEHNYRRIPKEMSFVGIDIDRAATSAAHRIVSDMGLITTETGEMVDALVNTIRTKWYETDNAMAERKAKHEAHMSKMRALELKAVRALHKLDDEAEDDGSS